MLPKFPNFKALELSDRPAVELVTSKFPPYSDFNFQSMWACSSNDSVGICTLNGNLVLKTEDYLTGSPCYAFLGDAMPDQTASELHAYLKSLHPTAESLRLMPEASVNGLDKSKYAAAPDVHNFDYVYDLVELSTLAGGKYGDKRRKLGLFMKKHPAAETRLVDLQHESTRQLIMDLNDSWSEARSTADAYYHLPKEHAAVHKFLDAKFDDSLCVGIFDGANLLGYSIFSVLNDDYAIGHFSKGKLSSQGIYEHLMKESAKELLKRGCSRLNYQEDMGLPGLRFFKQSFRPADMLMKYTVGKA